MNEGLNEEFLKSLSDEQKAQLKNCKSKEELLSFAMKSGQELSDEVLDAVSGGEDQWEEQQERCPDEGNIICFDLVL